MQRVTRAGTDLGIPIKYKQRMNALVSAHGLRNRSVLAAFRHLRLLRIPLVPLYRLLTVSSLNLLHLCAWTRVMGRGLLDKCNIVVRQKSNNIADFMQHNLEKNEEVGHITIGRKVLSAFVANDFRKIEASAPEMPPLINQEKGKFCFMVC